MICRVACREKGIQPNFGQSGTSGLRTGTCFDAPPQSLLDPPETCWRTDLGTDIGQLIRASVIAWIPQQLVRR